MRQIMAIRTQIDGFTVLYSGRLLTTAELCELGHEALRLIEEGKVT